MTAQPEYMFLVKSLDWQKKESAGLFFLLSLLLKPLSIRKTPGEKSCIHFIWWGFLRKMFIRWKRQHFPMFLFDSKVLNLIIQSFFFTPKKRPNRWFCFRQEIPWWKLPRLWCCLEREIQKDWLWPESGLLEHLQDLEDLQDLGDQMKHSIVFWFDSHKVFVGADLYSYLIILSLSHDESDTVS